MDSRGAVHGFWMERPYMEHEAALAIEEYEIRTPGAKRTVIFYAHYDGQPVDPKQWSTPPWEPVMRTASVDNGGQIVAWRNEAKAPLGFAVGAARVAMASPAMPHTCRALVVRAAML